METIPKEAKVVIIGGGVIGCAAAYHLAKAGVKDIVLLERKKIACGTSWHAAGILSEMRASESMIQMAKDTTSMFENIEEDTGHSVNFKRTGSLFVTANNQRYMQFKMLLSLAKSFDVEAYEVSIAEAKKIMPLVNDSDLVGSIFVPNDALICPEQGTIALAKGAKKYGAKVFENICVNKILEKGGRVIGVETEQGSIMAEKVIVTTGIWTRDLAAQNNLSKYDLNVPLHACEHYYVLTDNIDGVDPLLPLFRDFDARCYIRPTVGTRWHEDGKSQENQGLMCGFFERGAKPWGMDGIPKDFEFGRLEEDWDHLDEVLKLVKHRLPAVKDAKIETFLNVLGFPVRLKFTEKYLLLFSIN